MSRPHTGRWLEELTPGLVIEHAIQNARTLPGGDRQVVSKRLQFVELTREWDAVGAGYAPYLDYRPIEPDERAQEHSDRLRRQPSDPAQLVLALVGVEEGEQRAQVGEVEQRQPLVVGVLEDHG